VTRRRMAGILEHAPSILQRRLNGRRSTGSGLKEAQMVHPALTRALATAHIDDLHRAAERDRQIRLARRVVHEPRVAAAPIAVLRSASTRLRRRRALKPDGMTTALWPCPSVVDVRSGPRVGSDPASSRERPASSLTRTSCGSE
jgi:hypothetical protein